MSVSKNFSKMPSKMKFEDAVSRRASKPSNEPMEMCRSYNPGECPPTPPDILSKFEVSGIPFVLPDFDDMALPAIRETGVKSSIMLFADFFGCNKTKLNLIQFWFIDVLTDCLWRCQDEFQFPEKDQKVILEWMVYIFNLMRDDTRNFTRRQLIHAFTEAMSIAEDFLQSGCETLPVPEELFYVKSSYPKDDDEDASSNSSFSEKSTDDDSILAMRVGDAMRSFQMPSKICFWDEEDECLSSSVESVSEDEISYQKDENNEKEETIESDSESIDEEMDFYKPDLSEPARFLSSNEVLADSSSISFDNRNIEESSDVSDATWIARSLKTPSVPCPSEILQPVSESIRIEQDIFQAWYSYHIWQTQKEFMDDPEKGSAAPRHEQQTQNVVESDSYTEKFAEWEKFLKHCMELSKDTNRFIFKNTCVIMAIKQFFYDYFLESFQFSIITLAFRYRHYFVAQEVNPEWCIPKQFKEIFKSPAPKVPKIIKPHKPKKEKSEKKERHKKLADKVKSDKAKGKKEEKKKKKDDKKSKKSKETKEKKASEKEEKGLSKEEKARLLRAEKEAERIAEEKRKEEEHKRFMFPLTDAVNDRFFSGIFEEWVKPKRGKKDKDETPDGAVGHAKGKKKDKGSKGSKKSKEKKPVDK